jgi:hypothetical protein
MTIAAQPLEYRFSFHGVELRYLTSSPSLRASMAEWFNYFRGDRPTGSASLTIHFEEAPNREAVPFTLSPTARRLFSGTKPAMGSAMRALWQCDILQDGSCLVVDIHDQGVLVIDGARGTARGYFYRPAAMHQDRLESFFHYALAELLKRNNMFTLHATALEYHGRGLLIPGNTGCGKTTTLLALLRSGYRYLSDDHPVLWDSGTRLELWAAPMKIDVTEQTIAFFPELRDAMSGLLRQGAYKKSFQLEDIYSDSAGQSCEPVMILFPHVTNMSHSCLEPLPKSRALELLIPQQSLVYDDEAAGREFQALSKLVQQAACYRLHFGQDVLDLPNLITPLLERH